jgi:twitching motility protein PilJ
MKLRNKVLLIFSLGLIGLSVGFYTVSRILLLRSYATLEEDQTKRDVQRVLDYLDNELDTLNTQARDYAQWDDTYEFAANRNEDYVESNFPEDGSTTLYLKLNLFAIVNSANQLVFTQGVDLNTETAVPLSQDFLTQFSAYLPLLNQTELNGSSQGIVTLSESPMLVASRPIVTSDAKGPVRGVVVMGRYLSKEEIQRWQQLTGSSNLAIEQFNAKQLPADFEVARQALTEQEIPIFVRPLSGDKIAGYAIVKDISGKPTLLLRVSEPRAIFAQGQASLDYLVLAILVTGGVFGAIALLLLEKSILSRLGYLDRSVKKIGTSGILSERISLSGKDELSSLANTLNATWEQLERSQQALNENAEQLQYQNLVIAALSRNEALTRGDVQQAARAFTEAVAETLNVERASVWLYNTKQTALTCIDLYERMTGKHASGKKLFRANFPKYFEALNRNLPIVADNALNDPRLQEFFNSYLLPLQIASILDFPVQIAGRTVGVVRCERLGTQSSSGGCLEQAQHRWTGAEQSFVSSIANLVALAWDNETLQTEVEHLLDVVSSLEEGDFRVNARVSDRATGLVADTLNRLIEELVRVLGQVLGTAQKVSVGSKYLEQMANTVATNADRQAESVSQVLNLTEQVEDATLHSSQQVQATSQSLETVQITVERGKVAIASLTKGIKVLQQNTNRIVRQMKNLGEFVELAEQFVREQSQIASETQVLALNASLVANRASEQQDPRQFRLVAREFESIAAQVSALAKQTNDRLVMLEQRSQQMHSVVSTIDGDVQNLSGLAIGFTRGVEQSSQEFDNVELVTQEAVRAGETVAGSSQKILDAARSTTEAMRNIAALARQTAQLTQNTKDQSEAMGQLSAQLLSRIEFFRLPATEIPRQDKNTAPKQIDLSSIEETTTFEVSSTISTQTELIT